MPTPITLRFSAWSISKAKTNEAIGYIAADLEQLSELINGIGPVMPGPMNIMGTSGQVVVTATGSGTTIALNPVVQTIDTAYPWTTYTSSQTLSNTADRNVEANATSGNIVLTLPAANSVVPGRNFFIIKTDSSAHTVSITAGAGDTIDLGSPYVLTTQYQFVQVTSDGSHTWFVTTMSSSPSPITRGQIVAYGLMRW